MKVRRVCALVVALIAGIPIVAAAQEPARADSLEREIERLKARLDSLEAVLERLTREGRDTTEAADELARIRAAAAAAAGELEPVETEGSPSRTRNLNDLNPEISLSGDLVGSYVKAAGEDGRASAVPREFEFSFQAALDPYTRTRIFLTYEQEFEIAGYPSEEEEVVGGHGGSVTLEEGYLYWVALPGDIGIKAGQFRQEFGLYNRWHTHALFEVERPLASVVFLGDDGLIQTGLSLTLPSLTVGPSTQTAWFEATLGANDALFEGGSQFSYLGSVQSFWDVGPGTYFEVGGSGIIGKNDDVALDSKLLGIDAAFRWAPPNEAQRRDLHIKAEWLFARRNEGGAVVHRNGGYGQINYKFTRQWVAGTRVDYLGAYDGASSVTQLVPSLTWWQSEWVRIRAQYHYLSTAGGPGNHTFLLQVVWAVGPHRHETY